MLPNLSLLPDRRNKSYRKNNFFDSFVILHRNGKPIYSKINGVTYQHFRFSIFYSGIISAIISYGNSMGNEFDLKLIELKQHDIFFFYGNNNLIYVLTVKKEELKINKKYEFVNAFIKKVDSFFLMDLKIHDWSIQNINTQKTIENRIQTITKSLTGKSVLTFFF